MRDWVDTGEFPKGWKLNDLRWRNPDTKRGRTRHWQSTKNGDATPEDAYETLAPILKGLPR